MLPADKQLLATVRAVRGVGLTTQLRNYAHKIRIDYETIDEEDATEHSGHTRAGPSHLQSPEVKMQHKQEQLRQHLRAEHDPFLD